MGFTKAEAARFKKALKSTRKQWAELKKAAAAAAATEGDVEAETDSESKAESEGEPAEAEETTE